MALTSLLTKNESLISLDIGSSGIKVIELGFESEVLELKTIAYQPVTQEIFRGNQISNAEFVGDKVAEIFQEYGLEDKRVVVAMPGPSIFTKKIKMPKQSVTELAASIQYEAGSFIPHDIDAVKIDFHILGENGSDHLDILIVAVKNEIIDTYLDVLHYADLDAAVIDIDYYAAQNCFELGYPEMIDKTVALIDIGARYSSINICREGQSLFTGNISIGGKQFTEVLQSSLDLEFSEAEKKKKDSESLDAGTEALLADRIENAASEFNRQLSLFWNASGMEEGIEKIVLTGGGALTAGIVKAISDKTGLNCEILDVFRGISCNENFDVDYLRELSPLMGVCAGMAIRQPGDRIIPEY